MIFPTASTHLCEGPFGGEEVVSDVHGDGQHGEDSSAPAHHVCPVGVDKATVSQVAIRAHSGNEDNLSREKGEDERTELECRIVNALLNHSLFPQ